MPSDRPDPDHRLRNPPEVAGSFNQGAMIQPLIGVN
jgi:hypothetical protein